MAHSYNITDSLLNEFVARTLLRLQREIPRARLLEIGCGDLRYRKYIDETKWQTIFSDIEVRSASISLIADAQSLPFSDGSFDVVVMFEVIEHVPDIAASLSEIGRVLRRGGVFVGTFPFNYSLHELPSDYRRWTEFGAWSEFERHGLTPLSFERRGDALGVILTIFVHLVRGAAESIRRQRILFRGVIAKLLEIFSVLLSRMYCSVRLRYRIQNNAPGENLRGVRGHLHLWHLGYHFICKKN